MSIATIDRHCYRFRVEVDELRVRATRADEAMADARREFVSAIRQAHAEGLSQRQIARAVGRSQPEVARLIRFHGTSEHGRLLRARRSDVIRALLAHGLENVRVFGSTATGRDGAASDIDLLVTAVRPLGLLAQARAEREVRDLLGVPVDLILEDAIEPALRPRILSEAAPL